MLKAKIKRGRFKDIQVRVHQFCNDWVSVDPRDLERNTALISEDDVVKMMTRPQSPANLYFNKEAMVAMLSDTASVGVMFMEFEPYQIEKCEDEFCYSFRTLKSVMKEDQVVQIKGLPKLIGITYGFTEDGNVGCQIEFSGDTGDLVAGGDSFTDTLERAYDKYQVDKEKIGSARIDPDTAIKLIKKGDEVHVFYDAGGNTLVGYDTPIKDIEKELRESDDIQISGDNSLNMGHGVAYKSEETWKFVEHDEESLQSVLLAIKKAHE